MHWKRQRRISLKATRTRRHKVGPAAFFFDVGGQDNKHNQKSPPLHTKLGPSPSLFDPRVSTTYTQHTLQVQFLILFFRHSHLRLSACYNSSHPKIKSTNTLQQHLSSFFSSIFFQRFIWCVCVCV